MYRLQSVHFSVAFELGNRDISSVSVSFLFFIFYKVAR